MRHARRTVMTTADIDQALRVLNIEPLYGHSPHMPPVFRRAPPLHNNAPGASQPAGGASAGAVYFVEDEEIEFDRVLREDKIQLPRPPRWHAHWLAVEGVQPLIPENPPAIPREAPEPDAAKTATVRAVTAPQTSGLAVTNTSGTQAASQAKIQAIQQQQLVKQVLSRELQLYYTRLTQSLQLGPNGEEDVTKRTAALASLRHDAGLQALLPYLVRWVGEGVVGLLRTDDSMHADTDGKMLEIYLEATSALLENNSLFVEPYVCNHSLCSTFH
jgi:transcription initiation factor TFIID subunit 6